MAKQKRKVSMPAGIRNKMIAATSMLMVSCIMMVSSTYAWFTLSTAPEVKNISTTVAGNGSLEIALMPESGEFKDILTGNSGQNAGGNAVVTTANTSWGNLITLSGGTADTDYYGLKNLTLLPAAFDIATNPDSPLKTTVYGSDGRISELVANTNLMKSTLGGFVEITDTEPGYGVRAIVEKNDAAITGYGYVIDFAVRLNTTDENGNAGNLLLQTAAAQRVYSDGTNPDTMGGGSCMKLSALAEELDAEYVKELLESIRVTFVSNYGKVTGPNETASYDVLGTARLDTSELEAITATSEIPLYLYDETTPTDAQGATTTTASKRESAVLLTGLPKNEIRQISAIVWLDGANLKNASLAATTMNSLTGTLNLQFTTNIALNPAQNTGLMTPSNQE